MGGNRNRVVGKNGNRNGTDSIGMKWEGMDTTIVSSANL